MVDGSVVLVLVVYLVCDLFDLWFDCDVVVKVLWCKYFEFKC